MNCKDGCIIINCCGDGEAQAPTIGENGSWWIGEEDTGVKAQGSDGVTPHIGENGNWFLGEEDTGVKAQGSDGQKGEPGVQGPKGDKGDSGLMEETYSTTATRIGTWIDGKPLYRKVFRYGGTIPAYNGQTDSIVNVVKESEIGSFQQIVKIYGYAANPAGPNTTPFPHLRLASNFKYRTGVMLISQVPNDLSDVVVVVEYV